MIELYISETCPYCQKVLDFLEKSTVSFIKKDVSEPENLNSLLKLGGKAQVPFLDDPENGVSMFESDDIIEYIKNRG